MQLLFGAYAVVDQQFQDVLKNNQFQEWWLLVAKERLKVDDDPFLMRSEVPALDPRPKVVRPPQPAAFAAPHQP